MLQKPPPETRLLPLLVGYINHDGRFALGIAPRGSQFYITTLDGRMPIWFHAGPVAAILLGVLTGIGGGMVRYIL